MKTSEHLARTAICQLPCSRFGQFSLTHLNLIIFNLFFFSFKFLSLEKKKIGGDVARWWADHDWGTLFFFFFLILS